MLKFNTVVNQPFGDNKTAIYSGECVVCHRKTYQVKTYQVKSGKVSIYDPDPRGEIPEEHASHKLIASEQGYIGPDIAMCFKCGNDRKGYDQAMQVAHNQWLKIVEQDS